MRVTVCCVVLNALVIVSAFADGAFDPCAYVTDEIARGVREIRVPKGAYEVGPGEVASLYLNGVTNVTIDFQGGELRGKVRSMMVKMRACTGVTVRNLAIDWPFNLPFAEGFIERVDADSSWEVRIVDGYADEEGCWAIQAYDPKSGELVNPMRHEGVKITRLGPRRFRIAGGRNRTGRVGDVMVWGRRCETYEASQDAETRAHAFYLYDCADCRIEHVTIYSTPGSGGHAFREQFGAGGNVYADCAVVPRPVETDPVPRAIPRFRSGNCDGFDSRGMGKGATLICCTASNHCDDAVNIHGGYQFITAAEPVAGGTRVRAFVRNIYVGSFRAGDRVQVLTREGFCPEETFLISAIEPAESTAADFATLREGLVDVVAQTCRTLVLVTFASRHPALKTGSLFVSQNQGSNGFHLKDCTFGPNRARGFICNASFGRVENCVFDRAESQSVRANPSYNWLEGGVSRGVVFSDCTFKGAPVLVGSTWTGVSSPDCHRDFSFERCRFEGPQAKLVVEGCRGLTLRDSAFTLPEDQAIRFRHVTQH